MDAQTVMSLILLLKDGKASAKKLEEIKAEQDKLLELIKVFGDVSEAGEKVRQAEVKLSAAHQMVTEAHQKADKIKEQAINEAKVIQANAEALSKDTQRKADQVAALERAYTSKLDELAEKEQLIGEEFSRVQGIRVQNEQLQQELNEKLAKIKLALA